MSTILKRHIDPERAQHRRAQVLDAAAICFARSGFHGASMAEISKQAGMSAGHIYNYFDGKDAIIMAFVCMRMEHVNDRLRNMAQQSDPLTFICDDIANIVEENMHQTFLGMSLEIFAEASRNPTIASALREADADARRQLRALIQTGREQRGLAADAVTIDGRTEALICLFSGLSLRAVHHPDLDRASMVAAFRVAMLALLLS
ncbi:MAG TPA: TetR/AcrR family transcriptional regulator [Telluria sp.]